MDMRLCPELNGTFATMTSTVFATEKLKFCKKYLTCCNTCTFYGINEIVIRDDWCDTGSELPKFFAWSNRRESFFDVFWGIIFSMGMTQDPI